jgi:carbonic anhydrase/acetyltransferase-like protein (isoleucine patch superfamily)
MLFEHLGRRPAVDPSAYIAPTATVCGDVVVGAGSRILFGAVLTAEGGPIRVGSRSIVMENALVRGSRRHPVTIGDHVLVGPHAYLSGCTIEDSVFLATGSAAFNGARIERGAEVRINAIVHVRSRVPAGETVPIGWIAVGDPAEILPPERHDRIWAIQEPLNFPKEVFGLERAPGEIFMPELTRRYTDALARHLEDRQVG